MGENDQTQDMPPDMPIPEFKPLKKQPGRIGTTIGDYEVDAELGRGGMGVVYRARQKELNRLVALKMLTGHYGKEELERFLAEAQTAAGLHHTNIVHIYEVGDFEGAPYFSMEFVEGGTLAERLKKSLPTPREAAELLMPVARALHFAHQRGVVHRDMKPHNILIDPDGVPKVADFGIAKRMDNDHSLTRTGAVIGTPTYMAPEQAKGTSRDVGPVADVYSLGAILYELLTGRPPFLPEESDTPLAIRVISEDTPSPAWHRPEIPREIEIICMKCLQKDPRDRYASAAAFAEDLRRYLDDEGILARPPSRIVKGIKWVRRNPWRFTVTAALLLVGVIGGQRLYQWEFYERIHVEHAAGLEYVNGALVPILPLSEADTHRRAVSLQVTRRGRRGPVTKIDVLNASGNPATIRRLLAEEAIPLYSEGLSAVQPYEEKAPECSTVEQIYDGNTIREITGRDRDSVVNWRIIYDRPVSSAGVVPIIRARFTNLRGIEKGNSRNATLLEFERDASGRDMRVNFFNSAGTPALNGDGVFGYRLERDATGRLVRMINLDRDGRPVFNRAGFVGCKFVWDATSGYPARAEICDAAGAPALWNGTAAVVTDRDAAGNAIRVRRLGLNGQYAHRGVTDWVVQEIPRNERGEILARKYLRLDENGGLTPLSEYGYRYDENGQPTEVSFSGVEKYRTVLRHDAKGTLLEERFYDGQGQPAVQKAGFAGRKITYEHGPNGLRTIQTFLDGDGQPVYTKTGYRRLVMDYDTTGVIHRHALEDHDPTRFGYYSYVGITDFDGQGRVQRGTIRYEDEKGKLVDAEKAELPFNEKEEEYDEEGRVILEWQFGWSEKTEGASVWRKDTSWHKSGALRHLVWQACDDKREPLGKVTNKHPAHIEEDYDEQGNLERNLEADFDEAKVGFRSRERIYYRGKLDRVVHRNSAGEILKDIRVCIVGMPPNAPGLLAGLQVGDQLLSANGEPRRSAFEWVSGEEFPGGFIEILRDGQRLKIDGLKPGKLGILLEDRGPGVP